VTDTAEGTRRVYSVDQAGLAAVREYFDRFWDKALDAFRRVAEESCASLPEDLEMALAKNPLAKKFFATLDSRNRYAVLFRVKHAKKAVDPSAIPAVPGSRPS
jgi:uncharacterized protein YdeI (YjbR/CyaY-like superfamily)